MVSITVGSTVLKNQLRKDKVDFKNEKQEALYNSFM